MIIDNAFPGLSRAARSALKDGSDFADGFPYGHATDPAAHHMSESGQSACDAATAFVALLARNERMALELGNEYRGITYMGQALHAVMDANAPGHSAYEHYEIESWRAHDRGEDHISPAQMAEAITNCWEEYYNVYGLNSLLLAADYTGTIPAGVKEVFIECVYENGKYRMNITW